MRGLRNILLIPLLGTALLTIQESRAGTTIFCRNYPGGTVVIGDRSYPQPDITDCEIMDDGLGSVDYGDSYAGAGTGGGSGTSPNVFPKASNHPRQAYPATCKSSLLDRNHHAASDVAWTQSQRLATGQGSLRAGAIIEVEYDDGGTERWMITSPLFSDPLSPEPVSGTLRCP